MIFFFYSILCLTFVKRVFYPNGIDVEANFSSTINFCENVFEHEKGNEIFARKILSSTIIFVLSRFQIAQSKYSMHNSLEIEKVSRDCFNQDRWKQNVGFSVYLFE